MLSVKKATLLALFLFAVLALLSLDCGLKVQHDSGIYITLGKSLASGQGYCTIFLVGNPPHTKFPPVFPLLLAPLIAFFGYHFLAMKLILVALTIGSLFFLSLLYRHISDDVMAFLVVIFAATSHGLLFYSQSIMTEMPYLFFSLLALHWLQRCARQGDWSGKAITVAVVLIPLVYLTRLIGLSLLMATVAYLLCDSTGPRGVRIKRAALLGSLAVVPAVVWFVRNWWVGEGGGSPYFADFHLKEVRAAHSVIEGVGVFFSYISTNLSEYAVHTAKVIFFYFPWVSKIVLPLLLAAAVFGGFLWCVVHRRTIVEYYVFFYMCLLLPLPLDNPQRYLVPLIPFFWYYFFTATGRLFLWLRATALSDKPEFQRGAVLAATLSIIFLLLSNGAAAVLGNIVYRGRDNYYHVIGEEQYQEVLPWIKAHTSPDSVFVWGKPSLRFLWTERKTASSPQKKNPKNPLGFIAARRIDYVVVDSFTDVGLGYFRHLVQKYPSYFHLVYENEVSKVYRVAKPHPGSLDGNDHDYGDTK